MSFLNLSMLLTGIGFLSVPLLILLIHRRRQVIPWAAYAWMAKALEKKKKRVRVTEILKLISKLLLLLALALLVGRLSFGGSGQTKTMIVIDNSLSMGATLEDGTRLEKAQALALRVVQTTDGIFSIWTYDGKLKRASALIENKAALGQQIAAIRLSSGAGNGRTLTDTLAEAADLKDVGTIVIISDFQSSAFSDGRVIEEMRSRLPDNLQLSFLPVDERASVPNLAVTHFELMPEGLHPGRENVVRVQITNLGSETASRVPVTLRLDDKDLDRVLVSLEPREDTWVEMRCELPDASPRQLDIYLPTDTYPLDDHFYLQVATRGSLNVLAIVPEKKSDEPFARDVFFRNALMAVGGSQRWNYKSILPQQIYQENLVNYDLVVLMGIPARKTDNMTPMLRQHLMEGRGVIAFADQNLGGDSPWSGLEIEVGAWQKEVSKELDAKRLENTYASFMTDETLNPSLIHLFRYLPIQNATAGRLYVSGEALPVITTSNAFGGQLTCVGFMPASGYTDIYFNPNFVQIVQRLAWETLQLSPVHSHVAKELTALAVSGLGRDSRYVAGLKGDTPQPASLVEQEGKGLVLRIEPPEQAGFVQILEDDQSFYSFGYNASRADSAIASSPELLRKHIEAQGESRIAVVDVGSLGSFSSSRELSILMIVLAVLALILENYAHLGRRN